MLSILIQPATYHRLMQRGRTTARNQHHDLFVSAPPLLLGCSSRIPRRVSSPIAREQCRARLARSRGVLSRSEHKPASSSRELSLPSARHVLSIIDRVPLSVSFEQLRKNHGKRLCHREETLSRVILDPVIQPAGRHPPLPTEVQPFYVKMKTPGRRGDSFAGLLN